MCQNAQETPAVKLKEERASGSLTRPSLTELGVVQAQRCRAGSALHLDILGGLVCHRHGCLPGDMSQASGGIVRALPASVD